MVEEDGVPDVGYAMRPDLIGVRMGRDLSERSSTSLSRDVPPQRLRSVALDWNDRSRKVAEALGFHGQGVQKSTNGDFPSDYPPRRDPREA